jgi:antitoxin HicB
MTNYRIRLTLEPNPDGVFTVTSPEVPGLVTEGRTANEIQTNVQEALDALLEAWNELGKEPPPALRPIARDHEESIEMLITAG